MYFVPNLVLHVPKQFARIMVFFSQACSVAEISKLAAFDLFSILTINIALIMLM